LPEDGTMTVTEYWHVDAFRTGLLSTCEVEQRPLY